MPEFEVFFKDSGNSRRRNGVNVKLQRPSRSQCKVRSQTPTTRANFATSSTWFSWTIQQRLVQCHGGLSQPSAVLELLDPVGLVGWVRSVLETTVTPKQRALKELDELSASELLSSKDSKLVYENATRILSKFIESQFDFPATRQTSEEFLVAVNSDQRFNEPLQKQLRKFLESADMVKFAGLSCSSEAVEICDRQCSAVCRQADEQRIAATKQPPVDSPREQNSITKTFECYRISGEANY